MTTKKQIKEFDVKKIIGFSHKINSDYCEVCDMDLYVGCPLCVDNFIRKSQVGMIKIKDVEKMIDNMLNNICNNLMIKESKQKVITNIRDFHINKLKKEVKQ
jgi:hypothetical protein